MISPWIRLSHTSPIFSQTVPFIPSRRKILLDARFGSQWWKQQCSIYTPKHCVLSIGWNALSGAVLDSLRHVDLIRSGQFILQSDPEECSPSCGVVWEPWECNRRDPLLVHWWWAQQGSVTHRLLTGLSTGYKCVWGCRPIALCTSVKPVGILESTDKPVPEAKCSIQTIKALKICSRLP